MAAPSRRQYQIYIERPVEVVFAFHTDLGNHVRIAPEDAPEEVVSGADTVLQLGACVTFRARHGAIWRTLTAKITEWSPPDGFVDEQIEGPFASWVHRHRFVPFQNGTLMTDILEYEVGSGPLGALAERVWLGKHLDHFFRYRQNEAKRLLERIGRIKGPGA